MRELSRLVFLLRSDLARLDCRSAFRLQAGQDGLPPAWRIPLGVLRSRGYLAAVTHRTGRFLRRPRSGRAAALLARAAAALFLPFKIFVMLYAKISIPDSLEIGPGLLLSDRGRIILAGRRFGANLTVGPNVTAGQLKESDATPIIGDDVVLEGDCILFGRITVGDGCVVKPGTALCRNAPAGRIVSGNPAVFLALGQPLLANDASPVGREPRLAGPDRPAAASLRPPPTVSSRPSLSRAEACQ